MKRTKTLTVNHEWIGKRLDAYIAHELKSEFSRSRIKKIIQSGGVTVNDEEVPPHYALKPTDIIGIVQTNEVETFEEAEDIPLDIVYEDDSILIINKPAGMVVHPGAGNKHHTLVNALMHHAGNRLSKQGGAWRAGIVHRLDKDTSGLLVVAKTDVVHRNLQDQFRRRSVNKVYAAIVKGVVRHDHGKCNEPIGRGRIFRKKIVVRSDSGAKEALSEYTVVQRFQSITLMDVCIYTGRTHQIRVHMSHLGYPVLGDAVYGGSFEGIRRHCLHARMLAFDHPISQKRMVYEVPLPDDMKEILERFT